MKKLTQNEIYHLSRKIEVELNKSMKEANKKVLVNRKKDFLRSPLGKKYLQLKKLKLAVSDDYLDEYLKEEFPVFLTVLYQREEIESEIVIAQIDQPSDVIALKTEVKKRLKNKTRESKSRFSS
jgi:hypothetical protein